MSTPRALRPLLNPAYRWLAAALVASMIGAGVWMVALVWQIVAIGGGAAELSMVAGASAVGMLLTTLLGGALADRMSQRRILLRSVEENDVLAAGWSCRDAAFTPEWVDKVPVTVS